MSTVNFVGGSSPDVTVSWTYYGYVQSTSAANGVALPTNGRVAFNGNKPIYVTTARFFVAGKGGSRSIRVGIGGQYSAYKTVASGSNAASSVEFTLNKVYANGGNQSTIIDENGKSGFWFGRDSSAGGCTDGNTSDFGGSLSGYATYFQVPTAPTIGTATQSGVSQDVTVTWSAPSDNGGTAITGYIIDYSTSSSFSTYTSITTGSTATSYKVTGLNYGATYYFRVRALNATATAAGTSSVASGSVTTVVLVPGTDEWTSFGTLPTSNTILFERNTVPATTKVGLHRKVTATATGGSYTTGNFGMERVLTGLQIGRVYKINAKAKLGTSGIQGNIYRLNVVGKTSGTPLTVTTSQQSFTEYAFSATSDTHTIRVELAETYTVSATGTIEDLYVYDLVVTRVADDLAVTKGYYIQDNLYSGSLADHYDLTMRSIGGYWWVDKDNTTRFEQDTNYTINVGTWTDGKEGGIPGQSQPGELHYADIQVGYDTTQVINDIIITNEGLAPYAGNSELPQSWQALWQQEDATSKAAWSTRRTELQTNLWLDSIDNYIINGSAEIDKRSVIPSATTEKISRTTNAAMGVTNPASGQKGSYCFLNKCITATANISGLWNHFNDGEAVSVVAGQQYTAIGYTRRISGTNNDAQAHITFRWYDEAEEFISQSTGSYVAIPAGTWVKLSTTQTAPAGAVFATVRITQSRSGGSNVAAGAKFADEAVAMFDGTFSTYFDGEFTDTTSYIYDWLGEKYASISRRSTNRLYTRATDILAKFADPQVTVKSFRWNASEDPVVAGNMDVGSILTLKFNGVTETYRISGLQHDITPNEWFITVQVQRVS